MIGALLIVAGLSGCFGTDADPEECPDSAASCDGPEPPPPPPEGKGAVHGIVQAEDGLPLPGVQVALRGNPGLGIQETSEEGTFHFTNLEPGEDVVEVSKIGYRAAAKKVTLIMDVTAEVDFVLAEIPRAVPYPDYQDQVGRMWVSAGWTVADCTPHETTDYLTGLDCNSYSFTPGSIIAGTVGESYGNVHAWNVSDPEDNRVETVIVEATWPQQNAACRSTFKFSAVSAGKYSSDPNSNQYIGGGVAQDDPRRFDAQTVTSPVYLRIDRAELAERGLVDAENASIESSDEFPWWTRAFAEGGGSTSQGTADVGCSYEQPFTVYFTVFYGDPAPEGFSRAADA